MTVIVKTVFIYEFMTGGGLLQPQSASDPTSESFASMLSEGAAMLSALVADFARLEDWDIQLMRDRRTEISFHFPTGHLGGWTKITDVTSAKGHQNVFSKLTASSDLTIVVAPETGGSLARLAECTVARGGCLLGADLDTIRWASDKRRTFEKLAASSIPTPVAEAVSAGSVPSNRPDKFPVVIKPIDGAGSQGVERIGSWAELEARFPRSCDYVIESYQEGAAASVAVLANPAGATILQPCWQKIDCANGFCYSGGVVMESSAISERAKSLASRVARLFGQSRGYLGIDMVLGPTADGSEDVVIEINPRLTTSYVGLRAATHSNLAEWMVRTWQDQPISIEFSKLPVEFRATGEIIR